MRGPNTQLGWASHLRALRCAQRQCRFPSQRIRACPKGGWCCTSISPLAPGRHVIWEVGKKRAGIQVPAVGVAHALPACSWHALRSRAHLRQCCCRLALCSCTCASHVRLINTLHVSSRTPWLIRGAPYKGMLSSAEPVCVGRQYSLDVLPAPRLCSTQSPPPDRSVLLAFS